MRNSWLAGLALALALAPASPRAGAAQDPAPQVVVAETLVEVRLVDGSTLFGRVVEVAGSRVVLVTEGGARVELDRAQIRSLQPVRGTVRDGEVWEPDPSDTRLFFGPTGRTTPGGEGYLGVYELFFPFAAYALTDAIMIAAGTPIFPEIIAEVFYLAPKVRVLSRRGVDVSLGAVTVFAAEELDFASVGILYAAGTFGGPDRAATVGAGWGFSEGEIGDQPVFLGGGELRISRRVKLLTENYLFLAEEETFDTPDGPIRSETSAGGLLSAGVRLFGERLSADLGLGAYLDEDEGGCCLPLVNFVYSF